MVTSTGALHLLHSQKREKKPRVSGEWGGGIRVALLGPGGEVDFELALVAGLS